ncbi:MAG: Crp/Fnr family transcriptional regulator [Flavobacteriia bacterium]|nr:Crp/Fnr family transcriptional regulator [Flavobacteriia bacterium]
MEINCKDCQKGLQSIFCALNSDELELVNQMKKCQVFEKGDLIFQEASFPKGIYCVQKGKAKLCQSGVDGKDQILHFAMDGDIMGYRATLSGDVYSCSAIAIEKSFICFIPKDLFISLVEKNSKLTLQVIHLFSNELKKIESNFTKITQGPVKERIAQSLLLLKNKYGFDFDQATINITIKREELANMAGTTRETATRILYSFQEDKLIELNGKKIKIIDLKRLIEVSKNIDAGG